MVKDALDSLRMNWISRASSPLFGALAISWVIWNHRMIFTLFSDSSLPERFAYIDRVLYPNLASIALYHFVLPVVSAVAYLFLFPYPARAAYRFSLNRKKELNEIAHAIEGQRLLTKEEGVQLRRQMVETETQRLSQVEALSKDLELMRETNSAMAKRTNEAKLKLVAAEAQTIGIRPDLAHQRIRAYVTSTPFMLIFNKEVDRDRGSKTIVFGESGEIVMGKNENETAWEVSRTGTLEVINSDGVVHSSFQFDPIKLHFEGKTVKSGQAQSLHPVGY